jgi:hypothetical protein
VPSSHPEKNDLPCRGPTDPEHIRIVQNLLDGLSRPWKVLNDNPGEHTMAPLSPQQSLRVQGSSDTSHHVGYL